MPALHPNFMRVYPTDIAHPYPDISQHMADQIEGVHDLTQFDDTPTHESYRHHLIYARCLQSYLAAMQEIGWHEHTCDWDWYVGITLRDGTRRGDHLHTLNTDPDSYCDTFVLEVEDVHDEKDPGDVTLSLPFFTFPPTDEPADAARLRHVASITISRR